ncbi:MAG: hypothetical protein J4N32_00830 [Chloroflexi bacterium]|nr:hypothetical protein [Chloroflexota bacterium]
MKLSLYSSEPTLVVPALVRTVTGLRRGSGWRSSRTPPGRSERWSFFRASTTPSLGSHHMDQERTPTS